MARPPAREDQLGLLQGTLDMLILQTLRRGPAHGHQIATTIERTSRDAFRSTMDRCIRRSTAC